MVFETGNTDNWYGQQVFWGIYGHLAVIGFVRTGHELSVPYRDLRTDGNPNSVLPYVNLFVLKVKYNIFPFCERFWAGNFFLPSVKTQNGDWIQDGGENVFYFNWKFQKWQLFKKQNKYLNKNSLYFLTKNTTFIEQFFSLKLQNGIFLKKFEMASKLQIQDERTRMKMLHRL
jgi:hypothetical protein